jgi:hypothetical protein
VSVHLNVGSVVNPDIIEHYHAHVYYDPASSRDRAARATRARGSDLPRCNQPPSLKLLRSPDFQGEQGHASRFGAKRGEIAARKAGWDDATVVLPGEGAGAALRHRASRRGFCPTASAKGDV